MLYRRSVLALLGALPVAAWAHTAPSGWTYDPRCCNGQDCAVIPHRSVKVVSDGYVVTLEPGEHPAVTERLEQHIRYGDKMFEYADLVGDPSATSIQWSHDDNYHACIYPKGVIRCLYVLPGVG